MYKVDNAIIMAAGTSSRFAPLSYETHKGLITVRGEVLVERQIRQLQEAGIREIILVTGYKADQFAYLREKYGIKIIHNPNYLTRNNNGSIYAVREYLKNSYICSVDNYFAKNPFQSEVKDSYYAAVYADGPTKEWCMTEDEQGYIDHVTVGGSDKWIMMGHTFWNEAFSREFLQILDRIYEDESTVNLLWESIFIDHLDTLKMKIQKYDADTIFEFDTLDELREFDSEYRENTRSEILRSIAGSLQIRQSDIRNLLATKDKDNAASGFTFEAENKKYRYRYHDMKWEEI